MCTEPSDRKEWRKRVLSKMEIPDNDDGDVDDDDDNNNNHNKSNVYGHYNPKCYAHTIL